MLRWFFLNFLFALIPLTIVILIRALTTNLSFVSMEEHTSEILFFAIMVCISASADLSELAEAFHKDSLLQAFQYLLIFGAIISAMLYGALVFDIVVGANVASFRSNLLRYSIIVAISLFIFSTSVEYFLGRTTSINEVQS